MPINKRIGVKDTHFSGAGLVFSREDDGLAAVVRNSLIRDAQDLLVGVGTADLTDNAGGVEGILFTAATTDLITLIAVINPAFDTGAGPFRLLGGDLGAGLLTTVDYWLRRFSDTTYKVYLSKAAAIDKVNDVPVDITDAGSGAQSLLAIGQPTKVLEDDGSGVTTGFTAASWDTSADSLMTAYATLAARANLGLDSVGAGDILDGPGTSGGATIAVIDIDVAANVDDITATTFASVKAAMDEIHNSQATVIDVIDVLRIAVGLGRVPRSKQVVGSIDLGGVNGNLAITNGVTTDATTIAASATEAAIEIWLAGMQDNVAFLVEMVDDAVGVSADAAPTTYAA